MIKQKNNGLFIHQNKYKSIHYILLLIWKNYHLNKRTLSVPKITWFSKSIASLMTPILHFVASLLLIIFFNNVCLAVLLGIHQIFHSIQLSIRSSRDKRSLKMWVSLTQLLLSTSIIFTMRTSTITFSVDEHSEEYNQSCLQMKIS
jgi:hypothetical protein